MENKLLNPVKKIVWKKSGVSFAQTCMNPALCFTQVGSFVWLLFFWGGFERLGDEYFSWWYVPHMLALVLAFMHLYSIFNYRLFLSILFFIILYAIFYSSNTKWINFQIMFRSFTFVKCACFALFSTSARFELVKSPEVTLCG